MSVDENQNLTHKSCDFVTLFVLYMYNNVTNMPTAHIKDNMVSIPTTLRGT